MVEKSTKELGDIIRLDLYREAVIHAQLQLFAGWDKSEDCIAKLYKEFLAYESNTILHQETEG